MNKYLAIILAFSIGIVFQLKAQIHLQGNVFSYNAKKMMLLKKAQKDLSFEGPLSGTLISVTGKDFSTSYTTGVNGFYSIALDYPGIYQFTISHAGYSTVTFGLDYKSSGSKSVFESLFFILKEDENSKVKLGSLEIISGNLGFMEGDHQSTSAQDVFNSNVNLIEKAVNINNHGNGGKQIINSTNPTTKSKNDKNDLRVDSSAGIDLSNLSEKKWEISGRFTSDNLDSLKTNIALTKNLLNQLSPESEEYKLLSLQINLAEQKIKDKESIIKLQEADISNSNQIILFLVLSLFFLFFSLGFSFYFFRQKKKYALTLSEINEKISRINSRLLSSIRYASVIQENFLPLPGGLGKLFKESFLFSKPKDILSGDFHWFAEKNNHKLMVVADCTGHGVPGAMLTVLGNRILDEIIQMKGVVIPSKILVELNASILETFSSTTEHLDYGMDISVISMNTKTGEMLCSGIGNGIYQVSAGHLKTFQVTPKSLGSDLLEADLADQIITYKKGDSFYLFTDGFADQFGGNTNERVKFNVKRFSDLILKVEKSTHLTDAPSVFENELKEWMGEKNQQVDDICIMGFRV